MLTVDIINRMGKFHLLRHYLTASYCYYQMNESPMTDDAFDRLCVRLRGCLHEVTDDPHHAIVNPDDLDAGTCLLAEQDYPARTRNFAHEYVAHCHSGYMARMIEPFLLKEPDIGITISKRAVKRVSRRSKPDIGIPASEPVRAVRRITRRKS